MSKYLAVKMMKRSNKAQVAVEFLILVMVLFTIFVVYTSVTRDQIDDVMINKEYYLVKDVGFAIVNEINTAVTVEDGYRREFELPDTLEWFNYTANISNDNVVVTSEHHEFSEDVPPIVGNVQKGVNYINKSGGVIYLN